MCAPRRCGLQDEHRDVDLRQSRRRSRIAGCATRAPRPPAPGCAGSPRAARGHLWGSSRPWTGGRRRARRPGAGMPRGRTAGTSTQPGVRAIEQLRLVALAWRWRGCPTRSRSSPRLISWLNRPLELPPGPCSFTSGSSQTAICFRTFSGCPRLHEEGPAGYRGWITRMCRSHVRQFMPARPLHVGDDHGAALAYRSSCPDSCQKEGTSAQVRRVSEPPAGKSDHCLKQLQDVHRRPGMTEFSAASKDQWDRVGTSPSAGGLTLGISSLPFGG